MSSLLQAVNNPDLSVNELKALIQQYREDNFLSTELERKDALGQNILHVAMANIEHFKILCNLLLEEYPNLFFRLIVEQDIEGDTPLHQLVQFNRVEALTHLFEILSDNELGKHTLIQACYARNNKDLTAYQVHDNLNQNILHLGMGNIKCFKLLFQRLMDNPALFKEVMKNQDNQGDTVLHQLDTFQREEASLFLISAIRSNEELNTIVREAAMVANNNGATTALFLEAKLEKLDKIERYEALLKQLEPITNRLVTTAKINPSYKEVAQAANKLTQTFLDIKTELQQSNGTLAQFKQRCDRAISDAENSFKHHRGSWFRDFHPIVRAIIGVLATILLVPAIAVAACSNHGYVDTFFKTPKTTAQVELDRFQNNFSALFTPGN